MPVTTPYEGGNLERIRSEVDRAIRMVGDCWSINRDDTIVFSETVKQMVGSEIERWQLRLVTDAWLTHQLKLGVIKPLQACRVYWNEVDQNVFTFRSEILHLIHSQLRRCFLSIDDHHSLAMHTRQLIEAVYLACSHQLVIRFCYLELEDALKRDVFCFVEWENLYNLASTSVGWSAKQRKAANAFLGTPDANYSDLLKDDFQIRGDRLGALTMYFAENWCEEEQRSSLCDEVSEIQRCYRYLCKFVHVTPQSLRFSQTTQDDLNQSLVEKSVVVCSVTAIFNATRILGTLFFDTAFLQLRFQTLIETYCRQSPDAQPLSITDELLPSILSSYRDVIIPNEDGDVVLHKVRPFTKEAEKVARIFDALGTSDQATVSELMKNLRVASQDRSEGKSGR